MSWCLLLNKFPRSILSSAEPLLVLALIDRAGLSTEAELVEMFDGNPSELKSALLKLKMDEFLSFGEHHIKITASRNARWVDSSSMSLNPGTSVALLAPQE